MSGPRCHPTCRDHRPPAPGVASRVAATLERMKIQPSQMSAYLADSLNVRRFADLCYSHASAIDEGLRKSILADDIRAYPVE